MLFGTHIQNEEQTKINAHTGDEEAVLVDLLCFMEAYEAQIRLFFFFETCLIESLSAL